MLPKKCVRRLKLWAKNKNEAVKMRKNKNTITEWKRGRSWDIRNRWREPLKSTIIVIEDQRSAISLFLRKRYILILRFGKSWRKINGGSQPLKIALHFTHEKCFSCSMLGSGRHLVVIPPRSRRSSSASWLEVALVRFLLSTAGALAPDPPPAIHQEQFFHV